VVAQPLPTPETLLEHRAFARAIARALVRDEHEAEDVAQESVLAALARPPAGDNVRGWFGAVARNLALRARRARRRRARREERAARPERLPSTQEAVQRLEMQQRVVDAVLALEEPFRTAVLGRFFWGWTVRELARSLAVPEETVRTRLKRALARLKARLDRAHGGDRAAWSMALLPAGFLRRGASALLTGATFMAKKTVLIALGAAAAGSALTLVAPPFGARAERALPGDLRREVEEAREDLLRARLERDEARDELARLRRDPDDRGAPPSAPPGSDLRRQRIEELRAAMDGWFERGDAAAALAALRELVALETDGWPLAIELWLRIRDDSGRDSALHLSDMAAAGALNDPAFVKVMAWALENIAPEDFREHAAWDLPWRRDASATLEQFARILPGEADPSVRWALVDGLAELATPEATGALRAMLSDQALDAGLRGMIATRLVGLVRWLSHDEPGAPKGADLVRAVENVAGGDASAEARAAAGAALKALRPPATGFLVTGFKEPGTVAEAAGLRPGDVIVAYDGTPIAGIQTLLPLMQPWRDGPKTVEVVVVRDGARTALPAPRAPLGIYGLDVEAR
jgi:RNA polymerase sigma-70 factor (ECF subfamily)